MSRCYNRIAICRPIVNSATRYNRRRNFLMWQRVLSTYQLCLPFSLLLQCIHRPFQLRWLEEPLAIIETLATPQNEFRAYNIDPLGPQYSHPQWNLPNMASAAATSGAEDKESMISELDWMSLCISMMAKSTKLQIVLSLNFSSLAS